MSLKRKFLAQNLLLAFGLCAVAAVSFWRLGALREEVATSRYAFTELKTAQTMMVQTAEAKGMLTAAGAADRGRVAATLREAVAGLDDFINPDNEYMSDPEAAGAYADLLKTARRARERLASVIDAIEPRMAGAASRPASAATGSDDAALLSTVDAALWDMEALVRGCTT